MRLPSKAADWIRRRQLEFIRLPSVEIVSCPRHCHHDHGHHDVGADGRSEVSPLSLSANGRNHLWPIVQSNGRSFYRRPARTIALPAVTIALPRPWPRSRSPRLPRLRLRPSVPARLAMLSRRRAGPRPLWRMRGTFEMDAQRQAHHQFMLLVPGERRGVGQLFVFRQVIDKRGT